MHTKNRLIGIIVLAIVLPVLLSSGLSRRRDLGKELELFGPTVPRRPAIHSHAARPVNEPSAEGVADIAVSNTATADIAPIDTAAADAPATPTAEASTSPLLQAASQPTEQPVEPPPAEPDPAITSALAVTTPSAASPVLPSVLPSSASADLSSADSSPAVEPTLVRSDRETMPPVAATSISWESEVHIDRPRPAKPRPDSVIVHRASRNEPQPPAGPPPTISLTSSPPINTASPPTTIGIPLTTEPIAPPTPTAPSTSLSPAILGRAAEHLEYGQSLARRGSLYSARSEFNAGLKLIVETLDADQGQRWHAARFDNAFRAIKEAQDFVPSPNDESILLPLEEITRSHRSQILTPEQRVSLTPTRAMQAYFTYASEQLAESCGDVPLASELLHALGKLHALLGRDEIARPSLHRAISLVMYQAALAVDPDNHRSANELAVAYARLGYPDAAKTALLQSLAVEPTVAAWENLAAVHRQLGEDALAIKAAREKEKLANSLAGLDQSSPVSQIRWVSPDEFSFPTTSSLEYTAPSGATEATPASSTQPAPAKPTVWNQIQNAFRSREATQTR